MLAPLMRAMIAAELPVLEANGVSMWGYSVLVALDRSAIRTQAALAEAIGADKTRIIAILDELQAKGLIERVADPEDRRARLLAITKEGRKVKDATGITLATDVLAEQMTRDPAMIARRDTDALRHDRIDAPWLFDGPIDGESFKTYVEKVLVPNAARRRHRDHGQSRQPQAAWHSRRYRSGRRTADLSAAV